MAKVLILHDDPLLSEITAIALEVRGHVVTCAQDGLDARQLSEGHAFDLIVLDSISVESEISTICSHASEQNVFAQVAITLASVGETDPSACLSGVADTQVTMLKPMPAPELHDAIIGLAARIAC